MKPAGKTTLILWHLTASRESTWIGHIWIWRGFDMWYIISYLVSLTAQARLILLHLNFPHPHNVGRGLTSSQSQRQKYVFFFLQSHLLLSAVNCCKRGSLALILLSRGVCVCVCVFDPCPLTRYPWNMWIHDRDGGLCVWEYFIRSFVFMCLFALGH